MYLTDITEYRQPCTWNNLAAKAGDELQNPYVSQKTSLHTSERSVDILVQAKQRCVFQIPFTSLHTPLTHKVRFLREYPRPAGVWLFSCGRQLCKIIQTKFFLSAPPCEHIKNCSLFFLNNKLTKYKFEIYSIAVMKFRIIRTTDTKNSKTKLSPLLIMNCILRRTYKNICRTL